MKYLKLAAVTVLCVALLGCAGHGYEGEYKAQSSSSNELINAYTGVAGSATIVIGSDYIESQGRRTEFDDIFVRKSGSEQYLVFKDKNSEEAWKIIDKNTLVQGNDLINVTLKRIY